MPKTGFRVWQNVRVTRVPRFFKTRVSIPSWGLAPGVSWKSENHKRLP